MINVILGHFLIAPKSNYSNEILTILTLLKSANFPSGISIWGGTSNNKQVTVHLSSDFYF